MQKGRYVLTWSTRATRPVLLAAPPKTHSRVIRCAVARGQGPETRYRTGEARRVPPLPSGRPPGLSLCRDGLSCSRQDACKQQPREEMLTSVCTAVTGREGTPRATRPETRHLPSAVPATTTADRRDERGCSSGYAPSRPFVSVLLSSPVDSGTSSSASTMARAPPHRDCHYPVISAVSPERPDSDRLWCPWPDSPGRAASPQPAGSSHTLTRASSALWTSLLSARLGPGKGLCRGPVR